MTAPTQAGWAIELIGVGKSYSLDWRGRTADALVGLTLRARPGQVLGLLGPNGSGKSTALKIIAGLVRPTAGTCLVDGAPAGSQVARSRSGYLPETPRYASHLTGRELLRFVAELSGASGSTAARQAGEMLAEHELTSVADQRIGTYSKGQRQRLGLAQARVHDPAVLVLDEPASGLDPAGRRALGRLLRQEAARGRTVVFSSHLLTQAEAICDHIALLDRGRLLAEGSPAELLGVVAEEEMPVSRLERFYLEALSAHA